MLLVEITFVTGRYHATPWGRNVNEGVAEWPPSPYRLARALVDVWARKVPEIPLDRLQSALLALAGEPRYFLPPARAAHNRFFMAGRDKDPAKRNQVLDPFVALSPVTPVLMGFDVSLASEDRETLQELFSRTNYLGRSESWVTVRLIDEPGETQWNSFPALEDKSNRHNESVRVACLAKPSEDDADECWFENMCMSSEEYLRKGWSDPPALRWQTYVLPGETGKPPIPPSPREEYTYQYVLYALASPVLPRVEHTVYFAEDIRRKLMGIHRKISGGDPAGVSSLFSGKNTDGSPLSGHKHAFFLPLDLDGDNVLDHLLIRWRGVLDQTELMALDLFRSIWQVKGKPDVRLILLDLGEKPSLWQSHSWASVTPFVTSRCYRKGRGNFEEWLINELHRECLFHGLPEPARVSLLPGLVRGDTVLPWWRFIRKRREGSPLHGFGSSIEFREPVPGPFALGSLCHFGLGLFMPRDRF